MRFHVCQKGFTLVEMLVVTAIIGILVSIVVPQYASFRYRAYNSAAMADINHLKSGMEAYKSENDVYPVTISAQ